MSHLRGLCPLKVAWCLSFEHFFTIGSTANTKHAYNSVLQLLFHCHKVYFIISRIHNAHKPVCSCTCIKSSVSLLFWFFLQLHIKSSLLFEGTCITYYLKIHSAYYNTNLKKKKKIHSKLMFYFKIWLLVYFICNTMTAASVTEHVWHVTNYIKHHSSNPSLTHQPDICSKEWR